MIDLHFTLWSVFRARDFIFIEGEIGFCITSSGLVAVSPCEGEHATNGHLVGGKGACLIRTDDTGATQSLHRWKGADDGIFTCHSASSECQASCNDGRKTLRNSGNSQGHGNLKVVDCTSNPRTTMGGIIEMSDVNYPYGNTNECNDLKE